MYRVVLYYLIFLSLAAFIFSFFGVFPFQPFDLIVSTIVILSVSLITNTFFAKFFKVQTNFESVYITSLILVLIVAPSLNITGLFFSALISFIAQASKYFLAFRHKHIFNPAGLAIAIAALIFGRYASWWIGSATMLPFLVLGLLVIRKLRRFSMIFAFFGAALIIFIFKSFSLNAILPTALFFACVMLPEPLTTPPTRMLQIFYGILVGLLFALQLHVGNFYITLEVTLLVGNIFSFIVSPKERLTLILEKKNELTKDIYEFIFKPNMKLKFKAGQYLEWTLGQKRIDSRGNRRFFTIASAPTEQELKIGLKLPDEKASAFKQELIGLKRGDEIFASQLAGDFILPKDKNKKLVFIAGGIGITPFRSMIKYLIDIGEKRDIILMYSEKNVNEFVYKDVFSEAIGRIGLRVIYFETEKRGHMTADVIKSEIKDYKERMYYLSGAHSMVASFEDGLASLKISKLNIKVDYFPGY